MDLAYGEHDDAIVFSIHTSIFCHGLAIRVEGKKEGVGFRASGLELRKSELG